MATSRVFALLFSSRWQSELLFTVLWDAIFHMVILQQCILFFFNVATFSMELFQRRHEITTLKRLLGFASGIFFYFFLKGKTADVETSERDHKATARGREESGEPSRGV